MYAKAKKVKRNDVSKYNKKFKAHKQSYRYYINAIRFQLTRILPERPFSVDVSEVGHFKLCINKIKGEVLLSNVFIKWPYV